MTNCARGIISALVLTWAGLVTFVPTASAHETERSSEGREWRGGNAGHHRDGGYIQGESYRGSHRGSRHSARSYYYEDPYCGRRSSHISDFKGHYSRAGHRPLIVKVDIRSGRVLNRYRYDHEQEEWREWNRRHRLDQESWSDSRRSTHQRDEDD